MRIIGMILLALAIVPVQAEVVAVGERGFISEHRIELQATPAEAYTALTSKVSAWWDAAHSYSGEASNFSLDARAGGCFCEALPNGGSVEHMRVVFAQPGHLLRMQGGLGPLQAMAVQGTMEFRFVPGAAGRTLLEYRYSVSGFTPAGLAPLAEPVDRVQLGQIERLAAYLSAAAGRP